MRGGGGGFGEYCILFIIIIIIIINVVKDIGHSMNGLYAPVMYECNQTILMEKKYIETKNDNIVAYI